MHPQNETAGTWRIPSMIVPNTDEFMHVGSDGRIVHFVFTDSDGIGVQAMKLWFAPLGKNQYRVRGILGDEGWIVELIPTESGISIQREHKVFYMTPAGECDLPIGYPDRLEKAFLEVIWSDHCHSLPLRLRGFARVTLLSSAGLIESFT